MARLLSICVNMQSGDIKVGYAPTGGVAYPYTDKPEDIEAAKKSIFWFYNPMDNWTWNVAWFSDPVFLGHYPKEGLEKICAVSARDHGRRYEADPSAT